MTLQELEALTVLQLRKVAKEYHVVLGAGIDKAGIIQKIFSAANNGEAEEETPADAPAQPEEKQLEMAFSAPAQPAAPARKPATSEEEGPKYQAAWHSPSATPPTNARFSARPSFQAPGSTAGGNTHPAWQSTPPANRPSVPEQRVQPARSAIGGHRFGPAVSPETEQPVQHAAVSPLPERRFGFGGDSGFGPRATATYVAPAPQTAAPAAPAPSSVPSVPAAEAPVPQPEETAAPMVPPEANAAAPSLEDLLASGDYEEGGGVLELHPDGYGFLRAHHFLPSSRDVYVSMAQIRRFGLRTGDLINGKIRPQREGDKYAALLYIDSINGVPEEEAQQRPLFEELTPTYPTRRVSLESKDGKSFPDMRLIDLIAPLGFGQRALILCPPDTGKTTLMQHMAQVIMGNDPETKVLLLLIDVNPEDVTLARESVPCPVLASTFDQAPEAHLRLSEIVLERAMRLVEQKQDVVLLVDSLTRLAKVYTTAAVQQGRSVPGMVNPASLFRAKRLFGAARACKEGGSLTVIAAMDVATGSKVDDSVVEEFKGTANMELALDQHVARAGVSPAINLQHSFTKNADILLDSRQKEGLGLIRNLLGSTSSAVAIPQLESMMDKAATNQELLLKMKGWFALMNR